MQETTGSCSHYCKITEHVPLVALSSAQSQQSKATEATNKVIKMCLDYIITFPNRTITCTAYDLLLWVCSDGTYLAENGSKSIECGHYFLSDFVKDVGKAQPKINGPAHTLCKILKNIVASATECKIASVFENDQDATIMWRTLIEMSHPQPPALVKVDNTIEMILVNDSLKEKNDPKA